MHGENESGPLPMFMEVAHAAKLVGWRTERMRRWLRDSGALFRLPNRRHWYTTPALLVSSFPGLAKRLDEALREREDAELVAEEDKHCGRYVALDLVSALMGWSSKKTLRHLRAIGAAFKLDGSPRWFTTRDAVDALRRGVERPCLDESAGPPSRATPTPHRDSQRRRKPGPKMTVVPIGTTSGALTSEATPHRETSGTKIMCSCACGNRNSVVRLSYFLHNPNPKCLRCRNRMHDPLLQPPKSTTTYRHVASEQRERAELTGLDI